MLSHSIFDPFEDCVQQVESSLDMCQSFFDQLVRPGPEKATSASKTGRIKIRTLKV